MPFLFNTSLADVAHTDNKATDNKNKNAARHRVARIFANVASYVARQAGRSTTFITACLVILVWALLGPLYNYSDTWQLFINTGTTVVTFLMVFLIQSSQNRDNAAVQVKLDEIIRSSAAQNFYIGIEHLTDDEIEEIRTKCEARAREAIARAHRAAEAAVVVA